MIATSSKLSLILLMWIKMVTHERNLGCHLTDRQGAVVAHQGATVSRQGVIDARQDALDSHQGIFLSKSSYIQIIPTHCILF
jgi:hypothetical protein